MNKSIRSKLFLSITLLITSFIVVLWLINNIFLDQYYVDKKKDALIESAKKLDKIYNGNINDMLLELNKTASIAGSNIEVMDKSGILIYKSAHELNNEKYNINIPLLPQNRQRFVYNVKGYKKGKYIFQTQREERLNIDFLTLITRLNNGDLLIIRAPLLSIKENVSIANEFIFITGIIIIILGSVWAFIFSKRFTRPILELNSVARNIAKLDFTQKCSVKNQDEIGQLGESINYLSTEINRLITELNFKNQRLEEDIDRERKIDEMRKEFISNVSHELRTPISLIQGYAEGLISNVTESQEDRAFYCNVIIDESEKMNKLVKDLLNLSQIESGQFQIEKTEFKINSLIEHVLNKYQTIFKDKNVKLIYEPELANSILVFADAVRIEQVITNFINNAINHMDSKKIIKIKQEIVDDKVRIYVFNTGKHIPEDSLEKIWTSFYKVDKARTRAYGGYGLGLSIVRAIQDLHRNAFGVQNIEDGVEFWFEIDIVHDSKI